MLTKLFASFDDPQSFVSNDEIFYVSGPANVLVSRVIEHASESKNHSLRLEMLVISPLYWPIAGYFASVVCSWSLESERCNALGIIVQSCLFNVLLILDNPEEKNWRSINDGPSVYLCSRKDASA